MVKTGTILAVAVVAIIGFVAYELLKGGGLSTSQATGPQTVNPNAYTSAGGAGALAITEIYSPAYRYDSEFSNTTQVTTKLGLFNA